jgi:CheY-like chemotaxis protein
LKSQPPEFALQIADGPQADQNRPVVAIIEDHCDSRELLRTLLADLYHVVCFSSAQEALAGIEVQEPSIILTDLLLPDLSGWDLLRDLRARGVSAPVVAVTAHVVPGVRENVLRAGFADFVAKPILDVEKLVTLINELTSSHPAA